MKFPLIENFEVGYDQGVKAVFPGCTILSDYTGSFTDAGKGQALAAKQYGAGAYIIFQAAGGSGNGVIQEAKERSAKGDIRWAIGVDKDQYADGIYAGGKSAILTSMMKRVDVAAHDVAVMTMNGKFPGGQVLTFNLKTKGVGLPANNPNLSAGHRQGDRRLHGPDRLRQAQGRLEAVIGREAAFGRSRASSDCFPASRG